MTLFGDAMTSLTLVTVLDAEAQGTRRGFANQDRAHRELDAAVRDVDGALRVRSSEASPNNWRNIRPSRCCSVPIPKAAVDGPLTRPDREASSARDAVQ